MMMSSREGLTTWAIMQALVNINITVETEQVFAFRTLQNNAWFLVFLLACRQICEATVAVDAFKLWNG